MIKRIFDLLLSILMMVILTPIFILLATLVFLKIGSPILFVQNRSSLGGKPFKIIKFRTMTDQRDEFGNLFEDQFRLGTFGKFMRSTSLDELPELWNVLKGDISLVGPRPLLIEYLSFYSQEQARRHNVKSGITGWAQVNGRNMTSWDERFKLDIWYVDNQSFWLDIKILWMTVKKVINRDDISAKNEATMTKFDGGQGDK